MCDNIMRADVNPKIYYCSICNKTVNIRRCSRCHKVLYCSPECQKIDWPRHRVECSANAERASSSSSMQSSAQSIYQPAQSSIGYNYVSKTPNDAIGIQNYTPIQPPEPTQTTQSLQPQPQIQQQQPQQEQPELNQTLDSDIVGMLENEISLDDGLRDELNELLFGPMGNTTNIDLTNMQLNVQDQFNVDTGREIMQIRGENMFSPDLQYSNEAAMEAFNLEDMCMNLIKDMNEYGVCVIDNFLGDYKGIRVLDEVKQMYGSGIFEDGQVVSNRGVSNPNIRGDKIAWYDGKDPTYTYLRYLINQVDSVVMMANRMKNNGKFGRYNIKERTRAMIACYPGSGTHYVKHVDNPNGDGRCITAIYYLNTNWDVSSNGGLLRIFPEGCRDIVADIEPIFDRILFFWSDRRNPHEVQPAHRTRYAITLWYLDSTEREHALRRYQNNKTKT